MEMPQSFVCKTCGKCYKHMRSLKKHINVHNCHSVETFECNSCNSSFKSNTNLQEHKINFHPENGVDKITNYNIHYVQNSIFNDAQGTLTEEYFCNICGKICSKDKALKDHYRNVHKFTKGHKCIICKKVYSTRFNLKAHTKKYHSDLGSTDQSPIYQLYSVINNTPKCNIEVNCFKTLKSNEPEAGTIGTNEDYSSTDQSPVDQVHSVINNAPKSNLEINCFKTLKSNEPEAGTIGINEDNSTTTGTVNKKLLVCKFCAEVFNTKYMLNKHKRISHFIDIEHPIKCCLVGCRKSFRKLHQLRVHLEDVGGHNCIIEKEQTDFNNIAEFTNWKDDIERNENTRYIIRFGNKMKEDGSFRRVYYCSRSGTYQPKQTRTRRLKYQGTSKMGFYCPSTMQVTVRSDGSVFCIYHKTHFGHGTTGKNIMHLRLHKRDKQFIAGDRKENTTKTTASALIHKSNQLEKPSFTETALMREVYPGLKGQSMDDMVLGCPKYVLLRMMYASNPVEHSPPGVALGAKSKRSHPVGKQAPVPVKTQSVGPAFTAHKYYPKRPGCGPKVITTELDRGDCNPKYSQASTITSSVGTNIWINPVLSIKEERSYKPDDRTVAENTINGVNIGEAITNDLGDNENETVGESSNISVEFNSEFNVDCVVKDEIEMVEVKEECFLEECPNSFAALEQLYTDQLDAASWTPETSTKGSKCARSPEETLHPTKMVTSAAVTSAAVTSAAVISAAVTSVAGIGVLADIAATAAATTNSSTVYTSSRNQQKRKLDNSDT